MQTHQFEICRQNQEVAIIAHDDEELSLFLQIDGYGADDRFIGTGRGGKQAGKNQINKKYKWDNGRCAEEGEA
jgi:hypothetical protein